MAMATAFVPALTRQPLISPLPFKPNAFSSRPNKLIFPKTPPFISAPVIITRAKTKQREPISTVDIDADFDDEDFDEEFDEDEEDEDEEIGAFVGMNKWERNKPAGFGEGKVYDTAMEEKLLEEMENERVAQITADKKKEKEKSSLSKKQGQRAQKDIVPIGPTVRLGNLPKKKNIHRDLQITFKGFKGIVKISPAVAGNWKTRDPVCKGYAFVELVSNEAAIRFVNTYSKQDFTFGKVQKQISCEIVNPEKLNNGNQRSVQPNLITSRDKKEVKCRLPLVNETQKEPALLMSVASSPLSDFKADAVGFKQLNLPPVSTNENERLVNGSVLDNLNPSLQKQKKEVALKKKVVSKKSTKTAKVGLRSSMGRLKIKERTVLTGVFTKYSGKVASVSD